MLFGFANDAPMCSSSKIFFQTMTLTKQCTDRIVTIMPDGQFSLDRVLAIQTDVVLDPALPGYDKEAADKVVYEVTEMMLVAGD